MGKGIFIGLGGAGVNTAGHLKAKILFDHYGGDQNRMNLDCRFIFIDTDDRDINRLNEAYSKRIGGGRTFISNEERVNLGDVNPFAQYWEAVHPVGNRKKEQEWLLSWIDREAAKKLKNQPLASGASANRQQGRIAVWAKWKSIEAKMRTAVNALGDFGTAEDKLQAYPTINVLSGTCGGTGSSMLLDIAFMMDRLWRDKNPDAGDPIMRAVLFMPYQYIENYRILQSSEVTIDDYQCNGFAMFDELEAVLADKLVAGDGRKFKAVAAQEVDYGGSMPFPGLNFAFCIDAKTERGFVIPQDEIYQNTAELLYYWHLGSSAQGEVISRVDNEQQAIGDVRYGDAVPLFSTIGYRALRFPEELMEEYFVNRFLSEVFEKGLLGDPYEVALPDERRRHEHIQMTFDKCIARYLFVGNKGQEVPNLESERLAKIENKLQFFGLSRFKRQDKDAIDPSKVPDVDLLDELVADAQSLARQIKEEMKREYEEAGTTSLSNVLRLIRQGHREATGVYGALEDEVEDAILRYGLRYTVGFVTKLDNVCEAQVQLDGSDNDLEDKRDNVGRRLKDLEGEIEAAHRNCLEVRPAKRAEALQELYGKLQQQIEEKSRLVIVEQQIDVLKKLSWGEQGELDDYKRGLTDLILKVGQMLNDKENGMVLAYRDLPKRFIELSKKVTTTYLPRIESFVEQEGWKANHLFAVLYRKLVEQELPAGGQERPVRNGGDSSLKKGLYGILWSMLTDPIYTGGQRSYENEGHTVFFRKGFAKNPPEKQPGELLEEIRTLAKKYVAIQASKESEITEQRTKSLLDRFRALDDKEKSRIRKDFDETGTQTFCRMDGSGGPVYSVYAGPDLGLVLELNPAFENRGKEQFVEENTRNRLLKIKVITQQSLRRYPHYRDLQATYRNVKDARARMKLVFAPHIHRVFNEFGAQLGLTQVALNTVAQRLRFFALMLLYRQVCDTAYNNPSTKELLERVLELNADYRGQLKRHHSPFLTETRNGKTIARVCVHLDFSGDQRLRLLDQNFVTVSENVQGFKRIYSELASHETSFAALFEFDRHFTENCGDGWSNIVKQATVELKTLIDKFINAAQSENKFKIKSFYDELVNNVVDVSEELSKKISRQRPTGPLTPIADEDDVAGDVG